MDSRERTFLALAHQAGDRIPIDFWATPAVYERLAHEPGLRHDEFLDQYQVDLRYIAGPVYIGPPLPPGVDIWGVGRVAVPSGSDTSGERYSEVAAPPLAGAASAEEIENYAHWPNPDHFDYKVVERQCEAILKQKRVAVFMGDRLNRVAQLKPAMYLRGMEELFVDLAEREDMAWAIIKRIKKFYLEYLERTLAAAKGKLDIVLTGDDFGGQNGLLLGPEMWRKFIKPGFSEYMALIKSYGVFAMHHTCGSVVEIIPDMIEAGLDILQSLQPEARGMAAVDLCRKFGDRLCFHGGVSIQKTMPCGTPEDVRAEVEALAEIFKGRGGYIFCTAHNIQADTPTRNILELVRAYLECGRA